MKASVALVVHRMLGEPTILAVTNRAHGGYSLPGGKCGEGEGERSCLVRELREEVGMAVAEKDLVHIVTAPNEHEGVTCEVAVFWVGESWGEPSNVEPGTDYDWMRWGQLLAASPFRAFYERHFPDGIRHLAATHFRR